MRRLFALAAVLSVANAVLLSSSRLTKCIQTAAGREVGATEGCKMKFVVTLTANFGQNGTESIEVLFDEAVDDDGNTVRPLSVPHSNPRGHRFRFSNRGASQSG